MPQISGRELAEIIKGTDNKSATGTDFGANQFAGTSIKPPRSPLLGPLPTAGASGDETITFGVPTSQGFKFPASAAQEIPKIDPVVAQPIGTRPSATRVAGAATPAIDLAAVQLAQSTDVGDRTVFDTGSRATQAADFSDPLTRAFQGDLGQSSFNIAGLTPRERNRAKALFIRDKQFSQALALSDSPAESAQINRQRQRVVLERALSGAQSPIKRGDLRRKIKRLDDIDAAAVTATAAARPKFADLVKLKGQGVQKQRNAYRAYSNLFLDPEGNPLTGAPDFQSFTQAFISGDQQALGAISESRNVSQQIESGGYDREDVQTAATSAYAGVVKNKGQAYADSPAGRLEAQRAQLQVLQRRG